MKFYISSTTWEWLLGWRIHSKYLSTTQRFLTRTRYQCQKQTSKNKYHRNDRTRPKTCVEDFIQNRDSQKHYHQFIPNEILGEDLSIRSCMSSEQRDINMGYKEYNNSTSSLGLSLETSQKEVCVTESLDIEIGLKDNIPPLTSFQIFEYYRTQMVRIFYPYP